MLKRNKFLSLWKTKWKYTLSKEKCFGAKRMGFARKECQGKGNPIKETLS